MKQTILFKEDDNFIKEKIVYQTCEMLLTLGGEHFEQKSQKTIEF